MAGVKHLTEEELADRWGVEPVVVARKRKSGTGPKYLLVTKGRTKQTIRYRLADVEAYEESLAVDPRAAFTA